MSIPNQRKIEEGEARLLASVRTLEGWERAHKVWTNQPGIIVTNGDHWFLAPYSELECPEDIESTAGELVASSDPWPQYSASRVEDEEDRYHREQLLDQDYPDSGPVVVNLADVGGPPTDSEVRRMKETAYRRGFTQGWAASRRAVESGYSVQAIRNHEDDLMAWRLRRHSGRAEFPRELP